MFSKILNFRYFFPLILFLLTIPAVLALLKPGYWNMHDDMQMIRQLEMEKCLLDGQIPCRWVPDLGYGYGYPLFNFYPPIPYLVGQIFRLFGASFMWSVKLTAVAQIFLSTFFMYILAKEIFGKTGGFLSAIFYAYAPYHALNIYIRGAMNEAWAAVFFPLIFYFSYKLIQTAKTKNILYLALSFSGLLLSHNPMALTFTPFLAAWVLFWLLIFRNKKTSSLIHIFLKFLLSAILSIGLAAFFTLPVLFENKLVQIETMFNNYYTWSAHLTSLRQLFISPFWGDGASVWGQEDQMSFMVGYLHWIVPTIILFLIIFQFVTKKQTEKIRFLSALLILLGFFAAFMTHERSTILWLLLPPVQKIQFPWRFLNHVVFFFSLPVGVLPLLLTKIVNKKITLLLILVLTSGVLFLNLKYFKPTKSGPLTDEQKFSGMAWVYQVTSGIYDYLPKAARIAPQKPAKPFVDEVVPSQNYQITGEKTGTDWQFFNLNLEKKSIVTISQLAFPDFQIVDNGMPKNYTVEPELGRMVINLDAGNHQIFFKLRNTPIRLLSNILSLISWLILSFYFLILWAWSKRKFRK